jgi:hypothetical protein
MGQRGRQHPGCGCRTVRLRPQPWRPTTARRRPPQIPPARYALSSDEFEEGPGGAPRPRSAGADLARLLADAEPLYAQVRARARWGAVKPPRSPARLRRRPAPGPGARPPSSSRPFLQSCLSDAALSPRSPVPRLPPRQSQYRHRALLQLGGDEPPPVDLAAAEGLLTLDLPALAESLTALPLGELLGVRPEYLWPGEEGEENEEEEAAPSSSTAGGSGGGAAAAGLPPVLAASRGGGAAAVAVPAVPAATALPPILAAAAAAGRPPGGPAAAAAAAAGPPLVAPAAPAPAPLVAPPPPPPAAGAGAAAAGGDDADLDALLGMLGCGPGGGGGGGGPGGPAARPVAGGGSATAPAVAAPPPARPLPSAAAAPPAKPVPKPPAAAAAAAAAPPSAAATQSVEDWLDSL